jgi:hypothetical protein
MVVSVNRSSFEGRRRVPCWRVAASRALPLAVQWAGATRDGRHGAEPMQHLDLVDEQHLVSVQDAEVDRLLRAS